ncbi:MAG: PIN domain-containing protein [Chloroflexaceae bacterium]|nr:PIN domain-containing protein [Chloroflexaceae bacterium]
MITITDALTGVSRLGVDTAPLIYFIERHPDYVERVREVLRFIDRGSIIGYTSMITVTEVLIQPRRHGDRSMESIYRAFLFHSRYFIPVAIDAAVAERAADLRARYPAIRTPDAIQLATAYQTGCEAFLTNDVKLQCVTELRVILVRDLEP